MILASILVVTAAVAVAAGFVLGDRWRLSKTGEAARNNPPAVPEGKDVAAPKPEPVKKPDPVAAPKPEPVKKPDPAVVAAHEAVAQAEKKRITEQQRADELQKRLDEAVERTAAEQRRADELQHRLTATVLKTFRFPFVAPTTPHDAARPTDRLAAGAKAADVQVFVQAQLTAGTLTRAVSTLEAATADLPDNDDLRAGFAVARFFRAVEQFGQTLYHFGLKPDNHRFPLLRFPLPENPNPAAVRPPHVRRAFETFALDLAGAEVLLSGIRNDDIKLPLRFAKLRFDFDSDGNPLQPPTNQSADHHLVNCPSPTPFLPWCRRASTVEAHAATRGIS